MSGSRSRARDRMTTEDFFDDFDLPISRRGRFFQDSSFADTRGDFDKQVKDILSKWGDEDLLGGDKWGGSGDDDDDRRHTRNLNRYRNHRSRNLSADDQACTVTNKDDAHKIVLEVMDFVAGDVKVKVVGELELLVEGRLEGGGADGAAPRTFKRHFSLPQQTDMGAITSVMSQDGILTITAPKKGSRGKQERSSTPKQNVSSNERSSTENTRAFTGGTAGHGDTSADNRREHAASSIREEFRNRSGQSPASDFRNVPFKKIGRFFDDSEFEDSRWDFDKKVKDILREWGGDEKWGDDDDFRNASNMSRYRKLRSKHLDDGNQAVTVTSRDDAHKIVLDVMDFVAGDVKVKVIGELELSVEGCLEGGGADGAAPRTFKRRFILPHLTDMDAITSVMSADGILTITAPKKGQGMSTGQNGQANISTKAKAMDNSMSSSHTSSNKSSMSSKHAEEHANQKLGGESKQELSQSTQQSVKSNIVGEVPQVSAEAKQTSQSITCSKETTNESAPQVVSVSNESSLKSSQQADASQNKSQETRKMVRSEEHGGQRSIALPITTRGQLFFNDSFFEDNWKSYQDAIRDVLTRWDDRSSSVVSDDMTCYRKLRTRDMRDENQAVSTSENETSYKFVVDVHDFTEGGEVTVNLLEEGQVIVEGKFERQEGGAMACNNFVREFTLPSNVQQEEITAVMSSDGVLTIIAPKKTMQQAALKEESVSVNKQQASQASEALSMSAETHAKECSQSTSSQTKTVEGSSCKDDGGDIIIPVQFDVSGVAKLDAASQTSQQEKQVSMESQVNFNDDESYKKSAAGKDCAFGDGSEADSVHRRLGEEQSQAAELAAEAEKKKMAKRVRPEVDDAYKNRLLSIKSMGHFSEDDNFANYQEQFLAAVRDVLQKFRVPSDSSKEIAAYRDLRKRDLKLENQAAHIDDHSHAQTVVVDVHDFLGGEVTAEVVDGRELVVRGYATRRDGSSLTTLTFVKPIPLPEDADLLTINAFVSSDGVLVIHIPKLDDEYYEVGDLGKGSSERKQGDTALDVDGKIYRSSAARERSRDRL